MNTLLCRRIKSKINTTRTGLLQVAITLAGSLCLASPAKADVFQFIAEDGTSHFSDQVSDPRFRLLMRTEAEVRPALKLGKSKSNRQESRPNFDLEIAAAALANRIDSAFLHAVVTVESGYNAKAISPKGALGLMQLMPATARQYGVVDPLDAAQNLRGGAHHLRNLLDQFSDNKELALAAYNAGSGAVLAYGRRIPPYIETTRYVPAVMQNYAQLRGRRTTEN